MVAFSYTILQYRKSNYRFWTTTPIIRAVAFIFTRCCLFSMFNRLCKRLKIYLEKYIWHTYEKSRNIAVKGRLVFSHPKACCSILHITIITDGYEGSQKKDFTHLNDLFQNGVFHQIESLRKINYRVSKLHFVKLISNF